MKSQLSLKDPKIFELIEQEKKRQKENIILIASENFVSKEVLETQGSILTNKYAEGYPGKRYYHGCGNVDDIEQIAIERAKKLFNARYANVQPHSGSQANMAVLQALLQPNDKILSLSLNDGGHLTHGHKLSFSGKYYQSYSYNVDPTTEMLDYESIRKLALEIKPKLIIAGYSAYSRKINFQKFREIANEVNAYLMADIAHIAGFVACKLHPCPLEAQADIVTSTTHKTLRGPRGGLILTNKEKIMQQINRSVFPGIQGGPLMHVIAAKAVSFKEAQSLEFKNYQQQVIKNAQAFAQTFQKKGYHVVSQGTDNHLFLINLKKTNPLFTGEKIANILEKVNIIVNKNTIPFDQEKPMFTSGIRLGTPAMTTKGFQEADFIKLADLIDQAIKNRDDNVYLQKIKKEVLDWTNDFK
ncbi:Serine hydroxymethyltransferase [Candidatus Phytoplasma australiense]|uniref:Serine hydroxymethyltransferase n=2 Tax=Phytoplasma australiense TaxID=59748 RepID=GLYA_PHYAS|nr:serine hydroxymethyltransferase [Candidatus Phytoplasma australiense]B1V975.1 RecName: Full=Serine hydroxymethyltransferase; Short=SHMT; Short=Serine methylase [Candidatus Phytoplasma australiense]CAM11507.1 Serine hydroxymethyltransferase [Candidatus Phytoplasma australiense]